MAGSRFTPTQLVVGVLLVLAVGGAFFVAQSRRARNEARIRLLAATAAVPLDQSYAEDLPAATNRSRPLDMP